MEKTISWILMLSLFLNSCQKSKNDDSERSEYISPLERFHGFDTWKKQEAFRCEFESDIHQTNDKPTRGTMTIKPDMSKVRMDLDNGITVIWDGNTCWVTPKEKKITSARFNILTWAYFFIVPFKFSDEGALIDVLNEERNINGKRCSVARMTFKVGEGESADDWYLIFKDLETSQLAAIAYINTYFGDHEYARLESSSCSHEDVRSLEGWPAVKMARIYRLRRWSHTMGMAAKSHGRLIIDNPRFVSGLPDDYFQRQPNSREDLKPEAGEMYSDFEMEEFIEHRKELFELEEGEEYQF